MIAHRTICIALLLSSLPIAGCGTVGNLARPGFPVGGGKIPFGGVAHDMACIRDVSNGEATSGTPPKLVRSEQVAHSLLWAIDLPFSFVGDVLSWPYVKSYVFINSPTLAAPAIQLMPPPSGPTSPVPVAAASPAATFDPAYPATPVPATPASSPRQPQTLPALTP